MLFIKNGRLLTMEGQDYDCSSILVQDGKIKEIGENLCAPEGVRVIDAEGKFVSPGLIDAHTHLGISGSSVRWEGSDHNETNDPITPHMRALDGVNPFDESMAVSRESGVTSVVTGPGSANVIGGTTIAIKTGGSNRVDDLVIKAPLSMKCALGENPKNVYGQSKKAQPQTRMASASLFREALFKAREYLAKKEDKNSETAKKPDFNMKHEALIPVLKGEIPLHIHAHQANDIHTAIRISKEFNLKTVLVHCSDGHLITDDVKDSGYPAIVGPTMTFKSKPEVKNKTFETVGILHNAGIKVCITTDHPVISLEYLTVCAAKAVQAGMEESEALKAITIYPAEIMELSHRVGSLRAGKDADIVIWDKHPLDSVAKVLYTIIDGEIVFSR